MHATLAGQGFSATSGSVLRQVQTACEITGLDQYPEVIEAQFVAECRGSVRAAQRAADRIHVLCGRAVAAERFLADHAPHTAERLEMQAKVIALFMLHSLLSVVQPETEFLAQQLGDVRQLLNLATVRAAGLDPAIL